MLLTDILRVFLIFLINFSWVYTERTSWAVFGQIPVLQIQAVKSILQDFGGVWLLGSLASCKTLTVSGCWVV